MITKTKPVKTRAVYFWPTWLVDAVKHDATRAGQPANRYLQAIVVRHLSPESRRIANAPEPEAAAS